VVRPVYVTGMAWTTPLGNGLESVWRRLLASESGIANLPSHLKLRSKNAAIVADVSFDMRPRERLRTIALSTLESALADAERAPDDPGLAFVIGTSLGAILDESETGVSLHQWADDVMVCLGTTAPCSVVSTACSSGSDALAVGSELIHAGIAKTCVCGAFDVITGAKRLGHSVLGTMTDTEIRPFDASHNGTVLGEGGAALVLEAEPDRERTCAVFRGWGAANDAYSLTAPDPLARGAHGAICRALKDANLSPRDIDLVNAHASGTLLNDNAERDAFRKVFGISSNPIVFATKPNFGHSLGATGAIEAIATILALQNNVVPPIRGLENPDAAFPLPLPIASPMPVKAAYGLSLTLGFGGFNTCLVFERYAPSVHDNSFPR
jgi:3-oxoacyl-[acyl-carrier-protein] synthase II